MDDHEEGKGNANKSGLCGGVSTWRIGVAVDRAGLIGCGKA